MDCGRWERVQVLVEDPEDPWLLCVGCKERMVGRLRRADTGALYDLGDLMALLRKADNPREL